MRSISASALILLLKLIRRKRIYASVSGVRAGIAKVRHAGPAKPWKRLKKHCDVSVEVIGDHDVYTVRPRTRNASKQHVLYLHGGAYIRPITPQHWNFIGHLVQATGCTVTVPLYPLAPERHGTAALDHVQGIARRLMQAIGTDNLTFMGDSAGGGLAVALALILRDQGHALPRQLVLITPWMDVSLTHPLLSETEKVDPMLAIAGLREAGRMYAGDLPLDHPYISPLHANLSGLPKMTIFVGTHDLSHHDAVLFARRAEQQGCSVHLRVHSEMIHVWPILPIREAKEPRGVIAGLLSGDCNSALCGVES